MALSRRAVRNAAALRPLSIKIFTSTVLSIRGGRYNKKGGMKPGRNKVPLGWRNIDHNPAKIPKAWIPDSWYEENNIDYEREKKLVKYIPGYVPKIREEEHPDYHPVALYRFTSDTRLIEGLKQALNLIKSVLIEEMPLHIRDIAETVRIPNQDDRVIQVFRHALLFEIDPKNLDKQNCKKRYKEDHFHIFPSVSRYCPTILDNMIRLCQSNAHLYPKLLHRPRVTDLDTTVFFNRGVDLSNESAAHLEHSWKVSILAAGNTQLLSSEPLQPFASEIEVKETEFISMPDIFPVFPVVDLTKVHVYDTEQTGLKSGCSHKHLHTLIIPNTKNFTAEELYGQMVSQLFACLYSRAVETYGDEQMDLPDPVVGQCIASDGKNYQFMCMQLNTTNLTNDGGIKNMVWVDTRCSQEDQNQRKVYTAVPMYSACSHRVWQSPEYYTNYDTTVFSMFQALWLNGAV